MDKFNIYLFVLNFWHYLFQSESLDISNIRIENEINNSELDNSDLVTLSDIEDN
jgi:hypothetical protein